MKTPAGSSTEVEYPSSDGERMSENQWQLWAMVDAITMLQAHFADRPAHVTGICLSTTKKATRGHGWPPTSS